jgi:hypothetical protein
LVPQPGFSLNQLLIVIPIILILLAVAVNCGGDKMNASELLVIREMQTINQAQAQYRSQFGRFTT